MNHNITKKTIDEAILNATTEATDSISQILADNIQKYQNEFKTDDTMKNYTLYLATMTSSIQVSMQIIKNSLYELFLKD